MQENTQEDIVLISAPGVRSIPIIDNHEPMVNLQDQKEIVYGPSPEIPNNTDYTWLRKTVYDKLKQAQLLLPPGLSFCLYEGYRSLSLQKMLFENRWNKIVKLHPTWSKEEVFLETTKLVSPVTHQDGSANVPPHSTGAALDVYLLDKDRNAIEMGIHPKDWMEDEDGAISQTKSQKISQEAQRMRDVMSQALSSVDFINYPTEYWHWSYGDRYWAYRKGLSNAIYGGVNFKY